MIKKSLMDPTPLLVPDDDQTRIETSHNMSKEKFKSTTGIGSADPLVMMGMSR